MRGRLQSGRTLKNLNSQPAKKEKTHCLKPSLYGGKTTMARCAAYALSDRRERAARAAPAPARAARSRAMKPSLQFRPRCFTSHSRRSTPGRGRRRRIEPEPAKRGLKAILPAQRRRRSCRSAPSSSASLFNYTILRDTKDVFVVTAPKSGAEIIPFLKTYVNLPGAIAFTVLYGSLSNRFSQPQVFRGGRQYLSGVFRMFCLGVIP